MKDFFLELLEDICYLIQLFIGCSLFVFLFSIVWIMMF